MAVSAQGAVLSVEVTIHQEMVGLAAAAVAAGMMVEMAATQEVGAEVA